MAPPGTGALTALTRRASKLAVQAPYTPARALRMIRAGSLHEAVRGRTVMITGASSGIGRASALRIGRAGGTVLLVARTREKLEDVRAEIEEHDGVAHVHPADLSELDDIDRMAEEALRQHGSVDILVNNAGHSIRRSVGQSYDRMHDYQRTMQLNYFGAVKLILALLPTMREQRRGHIINISSGGVQAHVPRFSAYVASKAALDAFAASIASEVHDDRVRLTTIYMPLVRTPMIEPTQIYRSFPALRPDEAAELIAEAIVTRPKRIATTGPSLLQLAYTVSPGSVDAVVNTAYQLFPDSHAARGGDDAEPDELSGRAKLFARVMRGPHW